jgi:hypothetical protein
VTIQVVTRGGATASALAAAIAAAINANGSLAAIGVTATASGPTVSTNGIVDSIDINDPDLETGRAIPSRARPGGPPRARPVPRAAGVQGAQAPPLRRPLPSPLKQGVLIPKARTARVRDDWGSTRRASAP